MDIQKKVESNYRTDQNRAALLILIFVVMIGIPLWWKTTDIPRATLPYQPISDIPDLQIVVFRYKLFLINDNTISSADSVSLANELSETWIGGEANVTLEIVQTTSPPVPVLSNQLIVVLSQCSSQRLAVANSTISLCWSADTKQLLLEFIHSYSQSLHSGYYTHHCLYPPVPGIQISFTYVVPYELSHDILPLFYTEIDQFYSAITQPLIQLINFTVDSQIYHYSVIPEFIVRTADEYIISTRNISQVVNRIESNLNSYTLHKLKLNYLVYTPDVKYRPLSLREDSTEKNFNSALVSDWGSLFLTGNDELSNYSTILPAAADHLKGFLKFPYMFSPDVDLSDCLVLHPLEVNPWLYKQIQCYHNSAKNNLNSLVISISAEQNMFINTDIQQATLKALELLGQCRHAYTQGDLMTAYLRCKEGWEESYKANYDPSILSLLYFPEDQKYAIYVPLFLPVGVILLRSVPGLWRWLRGKDD